MSRAKRDQWIAACDRMPGKYHVTGRSDRKAVQGGVLNLALVLEVLLDAVESVAQEVEIDFGMLGLDQSPDSPDQVCSQSKLFNLLHKFCHFQVRDADGTDVLTRLTSC